MGRATSPGPDEWAPLRDVDAGVLPVKRLNEAKARLSSHFDTTERAGIAGALVDDALDLCARTGFLRWLVVTADDTVAKAARARGLEAIADLGTGLNDALEVAIEAVADAGARSVTVLPADVPLATEDDLRDVLDTGATSDLVLVPSRSDGGTNALHMSPPTLITPQFGTGSLRTHLELARRMSLRCSVLPLPRVALDIDSVSDVDALVGDPGAPSTRSGRLLAHLRDRASNSES